MILDKCEVCGKISLWPRYRIYDMPYQKVKMKSKTKSCGRCHRGLKKAFKIMGKQ